MMLNRKYLSLREEFLKSFMPEVVSFGIVNNGPTLSSLLLPERPTPHHSHQNRHRSVSPLPASRPYSRHTRIYMTSNMKVATFLHNKPDKKSFVTIKSHLHVTSKTIYINEARITTKGGICICPIGRV